MQDKMQIEFIAQRETGMLAYYAMQLTVSIAHECDITIYAALLPGEQWDYTHMCLRAYSKLANIIHFLLSPTSGDGIKSDLLQRVLDQIEEES